MTFRPEVVYCKDLECFFIDLAGFMDTNGAFFDLINCLMIKFLFEHAKTVKFLLPFTVSEINEIRGKAVTDLLDQINLMSGSHMLDFVDSVIPVITKCTPNDVNKNYDLELIQNDLQKIIKEYFKNQARDDPEQQLVEGENQDFNDKFSFKTEIFDPMDRDIIDNEGNKISIKQ